MRTPFLLNQFQIGPVLPLRGSWVGLVSLGSTQGLYKHLHGSSSLFDLLSQATFLYQDLADSSALQCLLQPAGTPTISPWQAAKVRGIILLRRQPRVRRQEGSTVFLESCSSWRGISVVCYEVLDVYILLFLSEEIDLANSQQAISGTLLSW